MALDVSYFEARFVPYETPKVEYEPAAGIVFYHSKTVHLRPLCMSCGEQTQRRANFWDTKYNSAMCSLCAVDRLHRSIESDALRASGRIHDDGRMPPPGTRLRARNSW